MSDRPENVSEKSAGETPLRISCALRSYRIDNDVGVFPPPTFEEAPKADFDFWCRMATWTIDEAVALSFEKEPEVVTWALLEPHVGTPFAESFRRVRKLALRAKDAGRLADPCPPLDFIRWTNENSIPFSENLASVVVRHLGQSASRKREAEQHPSGTVPPRSEGAVNLKSFNTVLKLMGGLVVAIYKPDPTEKRSDVYKAIQSDLDLIGVNLDLDTIRKWAKAGMRTAEIL